MNFRALLFHRNTRLIWYRLSVDIRMLIEYH